MFLALMLLLRVRFLLRNGGFVGFRTIGRQNCACSLTGWFWLTESKVGIMNSWIKFRVSGLVLHFLAHLIDDLIDGLRICRVNGCKFSIDLLQVSQIDFFQF